MNASLHEAFVLHRRDYRDTSLILDLLTRDEGRYSVVVRGARSAKSRLRGRLQPFAPLLIAAVGRGDLKTATTVDFASNAYSLKADALLLGLYVNELLYRLIGRHDPVQDLYDDYRALMPVLAGGDDAVAYVRLFELRLLQQLGYGINFLYDAGDGQVVEEDARYRYVVHEGFYKTKVGGENTFPGAELILIAAGNLLPVDARRLRNLTRVSLAALLGDKPLKSRSLFRAVAR